MNFQNAKTKSEIYKMIYKKIEEKIASKTNHEGEKKKLYYISAEFLVGKMLINTLINLGIYDEAEKLLEQTGYTLQDIEEEESEPSLGNGGLGRLAACFMDSMANLALNAEGLGLNYHFGLFRQVFENNKQKEVPNPWISKNCFLEKTSKNYTVKFGNETICATQYEMKIAGANGHVNTLTLFDAEDVDESIVADGINFDKSDFKKSLTLFLYPDDSDEQGRLLRVYQEYFMASCSAQKIINECLERGSDLKNLSEYAVIQINDTHPSLIIPELIRLIIAHGVRANDAIRAVSETVAYTNHTILAEALEKWPLSYLNKVCPDIVPIIEILDDKVRRKYQDNSVCIIDNYDTVHMAHMDIHMGFSINGVAKLHTEILKNTELNNFYKIYPHKFNNKTNGIAFGRWLFKSNPLLSEFALGLVGENLKKDSSALEGLKRYADNGEILKEICEIKAQNKIRLKNYLKDTQGIEINENAIFDMQIKRLHEYKRQQLNALYLIHRLIEIRRGKTPPTPICAIFAAKASPAYTIAKDIIHLILCLSEVIRKDTKVSKHLNVVMVENYNVSAAEMLIPACDISEQISLASKEASGTGNMKFMLNGAVTLGTEDGANVEIHSLVGDDNIYIFGKRADEVISMYRNHSYKSYEYYQRNPILREAVDFITSPEMIAVGDRNCLERLKNELIGKDWFMTFADFDDYREKRNRAYWDFENQNLWAKKMLINIANAGYFSSDRTIAEYNRDIWKLKGETVI